MVKVTMPCDAKNGPQPSIKMRGERKPSTIAMLVNGGSASDGYQMVPPGKSGPTAKPIE
jgi:hypothetical protein